MGRANPYHPLPWLTGSAAGAPLENLGAPLPPNSMPVALDGQTFSAADCD